MKKYKHLIIGLILGGLLFSPIYILSSDMKAISPWYQSGTDIRPVISASRSLSLYDTNNSHVLIFTPGSDITANRTLTFTTGDLDRIITLLGNPTLNDWFDQAVKAASSPTFISPVIANLNPAADFTLTQNGVIPFTSINAGAIVNTLYLKEGNVGLGTIAPNGQLSTGLANGQQISYKSLTELTTIAAAATTVTVISIPANVIVKAVQVRVTVVIPTAATFTVIGNTSTTAFNTAAVAVAAGSTDKGNLNTPYNNGAAQTIRITPNATPADNSGRVRVTIWYEDSIPPTS